MLVSCRSSLFGTDANVTNNKTFLLQHHINEDNTFTKYIQNTELYNNNYSHRHHVMPENYFRCFLCKRCLVKMCCYSP